MTPVIDQLAAPKASVQADTTQEIILDASQVDNAVLKRLIEEIQIDKENGLHSYNRTHNRHNRGR